MFLNSRDIAKINVLEQFPDVERFKLNRDLYQLGKLVIKDNNE